jgi:hypothetical protein
MLAMWLRRWLIQAMLALVALGNARADGASVVELRQRLDHFERRWSNDPKSPGDRQAFRDALSAIGKRLRPLRHQRGFVALRRRFDRLSDRAFRLKHGAPKKMAQRLLGLEIAGREEMQPGARDEHMRRLLGLKRALGRHPVAAGLHDRLERAEAHARYVKAIAESADEPAMRTAVEGESELTLPLVQMLQIEGGKIEPLLRMYDLVVTETAPPEQLERARKLIAADTSDHFAELDQAQRDAYRAIWQHEFFAAFEAARNKAQALARRLSLPVGELRWDDVGRHLGAGVQRDLMRGALVLGGDFKKDRKIPLFYFPHGSREVTLTAPLSPRGKRLSSGKKRVPALFEPAVEYRGTEDARYLHGVEVHRVAVGRAGQNLTEAIVALRNRPFFSPITGDAPISTPSC